MFSLFSYTNLNNGVINRGKLLHAAVHNLQSFDRTMDQVIITYNISLKECSLTYW